MHLQFMSSIAAVIERVVLVTDRSLYVSGEQVYFAATVIKEDNINTNDTLIQSSIVLYVELISPDGKSISNGKYKLLNNKSEGSLKIPDEIITGYYLIRAYTKNMRNYGPASYAAECLKIINPYRSDVLTGYESTDIKIDTSGISVERPAYSLTLENTNIQPGQTVNLLPGKLTEKESILSASLSIVPLNTSRVHPVVLTNVQSTITSFFCPETDGISVSGVVQNKAGGVVGERVNLSIIGDGQDYLSTQTDNSGRYHFSMPLLTGVRDIYLSLASDDDQDLVLLVDNDFCNIPVSYKTSLFALSENEKQIVLSLAANTRINETYADTTLIREEKETDNSPFYGTPDQTLILERYIQLPTLEEYFNELPGYVKVRIINGRKDFKVLGLQPEMTTYDPLVLFDQVAISNSEKVLAASPTNIARIEMISRPYLKGDYLYGGIISIISKKGDFAGIELPASGSFVNYRFFQIIDYPGFQPNPETPDARNTVLFKPGIENLIAENKPLTFIAPSTPGSYEIIMTSINTNGEKLVSRRTIEVSGYY